MYVYFEYKCIDVHMISDICVCLCVYIILWHLFYNRMQEKCEQIEMDTNVHGGSDADDHLFLKACGGWSNKGTIYGLGRQGPST